MDNSLNLEKPDIKISVKQTFGIDTEMEIDGFGKKMNMFLKLIKIINSTETLLWQFYLVLLLIKEF